MKHYHILVHTFLSIFLSLLPFACKSQDISDNLHGGRENGLVGKIPADFNVTSTGQLSYTIPISITPGIGGVMPSLNISYNSGNGTGLFGYGFDLDGLSLISRSPRNLFNDNIADIIRFNENDRFSLDGSRLQFVKTTSDYREYRTENNTFAKILAFGATANSSKFIVYTKGGIIQEYEPTESNSSKVLFWLLKKVTDTKGNYYTITYSNMGNNEFVPLRILYTGNEKGGVLPMCSIDFTYRGISKSPSYISGVKYLRSKVISIISIKYKDETVKQYSMDYEKKNGRLFLKKITESAKEEKFNPTTFAWNNDDSYEISNKNYNFSEFQNVKVVVGDFNGDGKKDFITQANNNSKNYNFYIYINGEKGFASPVLWKYEIPKVTNYAVRIEKIVSGDFNGDGYDDIVVERSDGSVYRLDYWKAEVDAAGQIKFVYEKTIVPPYQLKHTLHVTDINCDGAADLFIFNANYYSSTYYALLSSSTETSIVPLTLTAQGEIDKDVWDYPGCVSFLDLDGDGSPELLNCKEKKASNGCGSVIYRMDKNGKLSLVTGLTLGGEDYFIEGDFNGDGKADIITTGNSEKTKWEINFSTGDLDANKLFEAYSISTAYFSQKDKVAFAVDVNGDGLSDIVAIDKNNNSTLEVYINDGTGKSFKKTSCLSAKSTKERKYIFEDFDGIGKTSMLAYPVLKNTDVGFNVYSPSNTSNDLLTNITDGFENSIKVDYGRMTNRNIFTRGTEHTYPLVSIGNSWPIVSQITMPNSQDGFHTIRYKYEDAIYHKRGRGMLGFKKLRSIDDLTGEKIEKSFELNKVIMTSNLKNVKVYGGTVLLSDFTYDYKTSFQQNAQDRSKWVYYCLPLSTTEKKYEYNSQSVISETKTENEYDDYGNVLINTIDYGNKRISTQNTYDNNEDKWYIGRLKKSNVIKSNKAETHNSYSEYEYDSESGLLTKELYAPGKAYGYTQTYQYDVFGNIIQSTKTPNDGSKPRTKVTEYSADGRFLYKVTDVLGYTSTTEVDSKLGVKISETDINGLVASYQYNDFGEPLGSSTPLETSKCLKGWSVGHPYAPANSLYYIKSEVFGKATTWSFYDRLGQLLREAKMGHEVSKIIFQDYQYDAKGQNIATSEPYYKGESPRAWNSKKYDFVGRMMESSNFLNETVCFDYQGLVTTTRDPNGNTSSKTTNNLGQLVESSDALGGIASYSYDVNGNCIEVKGPRTTTSIEYDEVGNRSKIKDLDLGTRCYTYDAYGNKLTETCDEGQAEFTYDVAGRLIKEVRPDFTYDYVYDTKLKGYLSSETCSNNTSIEYFYDTYGREIERQENILGRTFSTSTVYDNIYNRIKSITYPSGLHVGYNYTNTGSLSSVYNLDSEKLYWQAKTVSSKGLVEQEECGNGMCTKTSYNAMGTVTDIKTHGVTNLHYSYDSNNNLIIKEDSILGLYNNYEYDGLNRLVKTYSKGKPTVEVKYDVAGNIIYKTEVGNIYYFDNSNQISRIEDNIKELPIWDEITYTSFDKVQHAKKHDESSSPYFNTLNLIYGQDKERKYQRIERYRDVIYSNRPDITRPVKTDVLLTKYYVGGLYEECYDHNLIKKSNYIFANNQLVAIEESRNDRPQTIYVHHDNLGSIIAYTDVDGKVIGRNICDPWGRKLDLNENYKTNFRSDSISNYGFTGHEHIDAFSMINMDGRIYAPHLGRFLSPDPFVQAPENSQSLNRYAYCLNNPLTLTDPTGYNWIGNTFCALVGIAVGFETGGLATGIAGAIIGGACGGASASLASCLLNGANLWQTTKSTLTGGFWGAASGIINYGIGDFSSSFFESCAAHSISDGTIEAMQGGHFEHGMFTGLVSSIGAQGIDWYGRNWSLEGQIAANATLGGTVSVIGGGKFASGAMTAAFQTMYNEQMHRGPYMRQLAAIDNIYRQSLVDYPHPEELYESLGFQAYSNGCAARMSYALNKSGVLKIPYIKGQTHLGNDGNYYFFLAKDMENWFSSRRVWGTPRVYSNQNLYKLKNGILSQGPFGGNITGHIEYVYHGIDGHCNNEGGAMWYYENRSKDGNFFTRLWKGGAR